MCAYGCPFECLRVCEYLCGVLVCWCAPSVPSVWVRALSFAPAVSLIVGEFCWRSASVSTLPSRRRSSWKGGGVFFPAHFLAAATAAHPPTTQSPPPATQPSSHPPSPTYLVRLSALPRQIILKRLWGGRGKWSKKFKSVGKKVGKTSRVHFHVQFFSLSLSHSLSLSGSRPLYRAWQIVAILDF